MILYPYNMSYNLKRVLKTALKALAILGCIGLVWYLLTGPQIPESEIISRSGLHWHPELTIVIKGEKREIPAGIGLGSAEMPIHTHDSTGTIHLEMQGLIRKNDITLSRFFRIWGKTFNSNCILDQCNSPEGKVKMRVNGSENTEFENYVMQDKDIIEIRYGEPSGLK